MTRFLADQLATSHYFDISKARKDLGYEPKIGTEEGLERTIKALQIGSINCPPQANRHA
jgi:nucleoside-diphosphate-sugar epimerase